MEDDFRRIRNYQLPVTELWEFQKFAEQIEDDQSSLDLEHRPMPTW